MNKNIILIGVVALLAIGGGAWYLFASENSVPMNGENEQEEPSTTGPVASVNGEEVSRDNFNAVLEQAATQQGLDTTQLDAQTQAELETQVVDTLISQVLLRQAAESAGVTVDEAEVDAQVETVRGQFENEAAFEEALAATGLTEEELRAQIGEEAATQAYLEQEFGLDSLEATEEEVVATYEQSVASQGNAPALEEVREQVEQMVIQQKQQQLVVQATQELRQEADVEIYI